LPEAFEMKKLHIPTVALCNYPRQRYPLLLFYYSSLSKLEYYLSTAKTTFTDEAIFHLPGNIN
jgi:hypothetical protein